MSTIDTSAEAVERLLEDVTPGPWRVRVNKRDSHDECDLSICGDIFVLADLNGPQYLHQHPNARFIAAARDLVPALLKERDDLRAKLTEARAELHGPIKHLSERDYSNVIAHLSPELEPNGELPNRNSLMMALVEASNAARKEAARVKVLEDALRRLLTPFGDDACKLDHHGYCQEHFIEGDCCVAFARAASIPADPVTNADCCQAESIETAPVTPAEAAKVLDTDAERFDQADWFWRTMDPDDSADTPSEAIHRGMVGHFCVCEIASSYTGPTRYGFTAPVLDQDSDDDEFLHFATKQDAIDAAKDRIAALRAVERSEA